MLRTLSPQLGLDTIKYPDPKFASPKPLWGRPTPARHVREQRELQTHRAPISDVPAAQYPDPLSTTQALVLYPVAFPPWLSDSDTKLQLPLQLGQLGLQRIGSAVALHLPHVVDLYGAQQPEQPDLSFVFPTFRCGPDRRARGAPRR